MAPTQLNAALPGVKGQLLFHRFVCICRNSEFRDLERSGAEVSRVEGNAGASLQVHLRRDRPTLASWNQSWSSDTTHAGRGFERKKENLPQLQPNNS